MMLKRALVLNEKGIVLVIGLMFMVILLIIGFTSVAMTVNELKISDGAKRTEEAYYAAHAGIEEARGRLRKTTSDPQYAGDPASGFDAWWSAFILTSGSWQASEDRAYDVNYKNYFPTSSSNTNTTVAANSLQSSLSYFVKIRHKREHDAELNGHTTAVPHYKDNDGDLSPHPQSTSSNNRVVYYGYGDAAHPATAVQFTTSGSTAAKPVEIITAYGKQGGGVSIIEAEVVYNPGPVIVAAVYAKGDVTGNGTAMIVDGNDYCGATSSALPPVYTLSPSITNLNGSPVMLGNPPNPVSGTSNIDIVSYVNSLKDAVSTLINSDQNGTNYGSSTNFVTCFSNTSNPYNVQGLGLSNVTGYGILLVEGDLTLGGGFNWNGLILCTGVLVFNGGGAGINIRGAVLANQTIDINGGIDIKYDSCMIDKSLTGQSLRVINYKEVYN